jgi:hypothetical protein
MSMRLDLAYELADDAEVAAVVYDLLARQRPEEPAVEGGQRDRRVGRHSAARSGSHG